MATKGNDTIDAGGGSANVYSMYGDFKTNADFNTGVVIKYNSAGTYVGTDTVKGFQQYNGSNYDGDVVHGKDGVNMTFWMGGGGTKTLYASKADNTISGGNSLTTVNYSNMTNISADLSGKTVKKGVGEGVDSFTSIVGIVGTKGDDVFTFNSQADVTNLTIDGGGGHDTLQKTSAAASTYDLSTMLAKVTNIEKIDFSTSSAADKITVDFTNLLSRGNETLTLNTGSKDTITMTHNTALDGWTHTTSVADGHTTDTYALGGHTLIWNH